LFFVVAVVAILVASVWFSGADAWFRAEPEKPRTTSRSATEAVVVASPADLPAAVRDRYRLRPDRRLLAAVTEIRRLRTSAAPEPAKAEFQNGKWKILSGHDEAGTLAEFPSFEEATDLLARWAVRWPQVSAAKAHPGAGSAISPTGRLQQAVREADVTALLTALSSLGDSPAEAQRDGVRLRSITSGLAWLSTLTVDKLNQADPLLAEAWAWLALERADPAARDADSEVLVARALGYEAAAARASTSLAADDPIRFYGTGDETRLGTLCAGRPADRPCHFLRLALLAERDQSARFRSALLGSPFRNEESLAVRGLETRLSDFDTGGSPGQELAALAMRVASPEGTAGTTDASSVEGSTRDFEAAVDKLASGRSAGLVDLAAIQSAYRAAFYSGLFHEAHFVVRQLASGPAGEALAASFTTPAAGTADELRRWIEVSGRVKGGSRDMRPLAELLETSRSIGAAPLYDLAFTIGRRTASTDPLRRRPLPALFARLDTRPSHLVMAARLAKSHLTSPGLFEQFAQAAADAAPHLSEELPALAAEMREDAGRLREIAHDPAMPGYAQTVALATLAELGKADDAFVRARYEAIAADPDEGTAPLLDFLEKRGDLKGAYAAVEAAIQRGNQHGGLGLAHLQTEKARLQLAMGDPEKAYAALEPALAVYKEETLLQGATIELARNRPESALKLAQASLERYPDNASETSGLIARARWQLNDYSTAAKELAASRNGIVGAWNRYLPEAFAETFATAPADSVRRAFSELAATGIAPHVLADVAVSLGKKRGLEIALPLLEGLHDPAPEWQDYIRLATYDLIREKSTADAALAWVKSAVRDRSHNFALALYQMRKYELLLGLFAEGEPNTKPNLVRMLKAASLLHLRETRGPRWDGLAVEIAKDSGDEFFSRASRYLAGRIDAAGLLQGPRDPDAASLASIGWVMGVKAASERRFADADGWFQVALESGLQTQPPHAWAWVIESDWQKVDRSLAILEKKGKF
jgi:tetratricopeptide (TPR) repeat protein